MPDHPRYIVWCPTGPYPPRVTHADRDEARHAAAQMARRFGSQRFYVAELVDVYEVLDVEHTDLRAEREANDVRRLTEPSQPPIGLADEPSAPVNEEDPAPLLHEDGTHRDDCPCSGCSIPF